MQEQANEQTTSTLPTSQQLAPVSMVETIENDDDPDVIFMKAVAEIDTQPLTMKREPFTIGEILEVCLLVSVLFLSLFGVIWQCITFPHTLVIVYAKANPASITATLDVPTRTLAPVTITRSVTAPTTGKGHQDATQAVGRLTFYNAAFTPQTIQAGSVFTGANGVEILTNETVTVPANTPPQDGIASITAHAQTRGSNGNMQAFALNGQVSSSLYVKNLMSFTGGRDARTYQAVGQSDIDSLTSKVQKTLETAFTTAFPVRPGEKAQPTTCHTTTTADHGLGQEAQTVTLNISETCSAFAYSQSQLQADATQLFTTQTKPGAQYKVVGSLTPQVISVAPFTVILSGKWAYIFTPDYQQYLAEKIAGDTPNQARKVLLRTGVIAYANIPSPLPPAAMYINFLVLVG